MAHDLATILNAAKIQKILNEVQNAEIVIIDNDYHYDRKTAYAERLCISEKDFDNVLWFIPEEDIYDDRMVERVQLHLTGNRKDIGSFAILDIKNEKMHKAFPNNVVDCSEIMTEQNADEAIWIMTNFGKERKMTGNTWFTSDSHFFHTNIVKYCNRPWNSGVGEDGELIVTEKDVDNMNKALIERWNKVVGKDDIVWHLGDFCFGKKENITKILPKLNGKIRLVLGNHDRHKLKFYYDAGFARVYDHPVVINQFVILSHAPLEFVRGQFFNVFGHVHDSSTYKTWSKDSCCVCVERHDYTPISWTEIEKHYKELNKDD